MRTAATLLAVAALLAAAAGIEAQLRSIPRPDPLGRQLLYLPTAEYLNIMSLGNRQLAADYLYIWAIQYYSQFEPNERFLYLDTVFDLITDLDPLYRDPYRIGALIMLIEAQQQPELRQGLVLGLLDKGIRAMPDDYALAEEAAWKCYIFFRDNELAARYAEIAASRPNAPHWTLRFRGHLLAEHWTLAQAIEYWEEVLRSATTDYQRQVSDNHLYDLKVERDRELFEPFLSVFRSLHGRCPESWREVAESRVAVGERVLTEAPLDHAGNAYGIDAESCTLVAEKHLIED